MLSGLDPIYSFGMYSHCLLRQHEDKSSLLNDGGEMIDAVPHVTLFYLSNISLSVFVMWLPTESLASTSVLQMQ